MSKDYGEENPFCPCPFFMFVFNQLFSIHLQRSAKSLIRKMFQSKHSEWILRLLLLWSSLSLSRFLVCFLSLNNFAREILGQEKKRYQVQSWVFVFAIFFYLLTGHIFFLQLSKVTEWTKYVDMLVICVRFFFTVFWATISPSACCELSCWEHQSWSKLVLNLFTYSVYW